MRILRAALIFLSALSPIAAMAQSTVLQGGAWTPGHVPQYSTYGSQPVVIDGGGSGGGAIGQNFSELGVVSRSPTNTYPSANSGNGPNGEHGCLYDAPITNATGYHYLCLDPNAQGGGLISYGAGGIASQNGLSFKINGVVYNVGQAGPLFPAGPTVLGGVYAQTSYAGLVGLGSAANGNTAANNTALSAFPSTAGPVTRLGYAAVGDAPPLLFTASGSACSLNSGAGDGGTQAPTSDGKCWIAQLPALPDLRIWMGASSNAYPALVAAVASSAEGVTIPPGTFTIPTCGIAVNKPFTIQGSGQGVSFLSVGCATGDVFVLSGTTLAGAGSSIMVNDLAVTHSVTRTGGADFHCQSPNCFIDRMRFNGPAIGLWFDNQSTLSVAKDITFRNIVAESVYSKSTGILISGMPAAIRLESITADVDNTANIPRSCIELQGGDATQILGNIELIHCRSDLLVDPPTGSNVLSTQLIGGYYDTPWGTASLPAYSLELNAVGGYIARFDAIGTWFGDATVGQTGVVGEGVHLSTGTGLGYGFHCTGCVFGINANYGVNIASSNWTDVRINGGCMGQNGTADFIGSVTYTANVSLDNVEHHCGQFSASPTGVVIPVNAGNWHISGNDFVGVATPISGAANLSSGFITENPGYNPVGSHFVSMTGSPLTHCAPATPETVYISGGTVTAISHDGGTGLTSGTFSLGAQECISITYTAAPTVIAVVH